MNEIPINLIFLLVVLLLLSAFFSSTETAFSSANKIRLKNYAEEGRRGAKNAYEIINNFDHALSTILIGNNLVNIAAATISGNIAANIFGGNTGLVISTVIMTILVLIFGEVLPKSFAKENAEMLALSISGILIFLMKLFKPLTWMLVQLKVLLSKIVQSKEAIPSITEQELKEMINISEEEGVIENHERELVQNSLDFNDIKVGEILTPRTDIIAVDIASPVDSISRLLLEERFSRVPVYEGTIDNIIGILSERDFLRHVIRKKSFVIRELLRTPLFVYESMTVSRLLAQLQKDHLHMAIVIDEFGGTSGLITLEDILEELVGEIWDEHDEKTNDYLEIDDHTFQFSGDFPLEEFARMLNVELPDSAYYTLGGWLGEEFQKIPSENEKLTYDTFSITITEAEERRIRKVKVTKLD
ncbi:hemolysin family protein [Bacillus suaedae]|uniref:HlyC/CorC family transporter n=1 Tax=Halalkalibacter suaedae TaxID=2822140 RepID=A0A941AN92_9BACI|nr:hemolysin family protein [Bacillus suaedae]MBP3951385.1 HlyC/CorC family transporter [Bacillus suaedae]